MKNILVRRGLVGFLSLFISINVCSQKDNSFWVDSLYNSFSIEERVAQLFVCQTNWPYNKVHLKKKSAPEPGFLLKKNYTNSEIKKILDNSHIFFINDIETYQINDNILKFVNKNLVTSYKSFVLGLLEARGGLLLNNMEFDLLFNQSKNIRLPKYRIVLNDFQDDIGYLAVHTMPSMLLDLKSKKESDNHISGRYNNKLINDEEISVESLLRPGIIFSTDDYEKEFKILLKAFKKNWLSEDLLEMVCKYILQQKFENLKNAQPNFDQVAFNKLLESSIGFFQNPDKNVLPITDLTVDIRFYDNRADKFDSFFNITDKYYNVDNSSNKIRKNVYLLDEKSHINKDEFLYELYSSSDISENILIWAGDFQSFPFDEPFQHFDVVIASAFSNGLVWDMLAQALFNGIGVESKTDVSGFPDVLRNFAQNIPATRLKYGLAQEVGLSADTLSLIDIIIKDAILKKATPGAQILVVKDGVVIYDRCFGNINYSTKQKVDEHTLYDLASITKIASTLPVMMSLYDEGKWRFNDSLNSYFSIADTCAKKDITIRELLLHESGLNSFIPFYHQLLDTAKIEGTLFSRRKSLKYSIQMGERLFLNSGIKYLDDYFSKDREVNYSFQVADKMFLRDDFQDSIISKIFASNLRRKEYLYSDLNFILLEKIASEISKVSIDKYVDSLFYKPMGANGLTYNPLQKFNIDDIAPTEDDKYFRFQEIRGYVHDPAAAVMGGVAGHAGLFGNANDVAKIMQMFLNNGVYGGKRYLNSETVRFFTSKQKDKNRRGLGFDKPVYGNGNNSPTGKLVSPKSFGHTGFTGTIAWADPEYNLVYIFLSNRTYSNGYNSKLLTMNVRTEIQDVIYKAILQKTP